MSKKILFVGTSTLDYIALVEKVPESDERIKALDLITSGGGPAANAAVSAKTLGAEVSIISIVGNDSAGREIINELQHFGVDTTGIQISNRGSSPTSLIHVEKRSGLRSITHFGGVSKYYDFDLFPLKLLEESSIVHADGNYIPLTLHTFRLAKKLGKITSLDGGNIQENDLFTLLPYTDILITDMKSIPKELKGHNQRDICLQLSKFGPKTVGITKGKHGCILFHTNLFFEEPNYPVDVMDTTGAGDNFHGAFAFATWKGLSPGKCLRLSNIFAANSCKALGGRGNLQSYETIKGLIN